MLFIDIDIDIDIYLATYSYCFLLTFKHCLIQLSCTPSTSLLSRWEFLHSGTNKGISNLVLIIFARHVEVLKKCNFEF